MDGEKNRHAMPDNGRCLMAVGYGGCGCGVRDIQKTDANCIVTSVMVMLT